MKSLLLALLLLPSLSPTLSAQPAVTWRQATPTEMRKVLPARAQAGKERIETDMRTASGIIDSQGKVIAAVAMLTAGYAAVGKYSHFFLVQSPVTIGGVTFQPGSYLVGWKHVDDSLAVSFYEAQTEAKRGTFTAHRLTTGSRVEPFRIWPPSAGQMIQIGRFSLPYAVSK